MTDRGIAKEIEADVRHGSRLAWWTLFWMSTIVALVYLVMGSSQAMKAAWFEDLLGLVPATVYLLSVHWEQKSSNARFRYGFRRVNSLAFIVAAVALLAVGGFLAFESLMALVKMEHPTIETVRVLGQTVWLGWLMIAVLAYSAVVPVILGRKKLPVARRTQDKVLHTDALMQKADWQTSLAAIVGIIGIGFGLWWADAAAALLISASIIWDGFVSIRQAIAELVDGMPRKLENLEIAADALHLERALQERFPGAELRMRQSGRYILVQIVGAHSQPLPPARDLMPEGHAWRLDQISFVPE